jgi:uncharacterized protein YjiK
VNSGKGSVEEPAPAPLVRKFFTLAEEDYWRLEAAEQFDASGLVFDEGGLLVVNDKRPGLYRVEFGEGHSARLVAEGGFTLEVLKGLLPGQGRFDLEGLARDERGRIYVCEESGRSIFRLDPETRGVERLGIDWGPVKEFFYELAGNASFEGVTVGGGKLWVANERERAVVIEVDLDSLRVARSFAVAPAAWGLFLHYSDLAWRDGHLFVLARHHRVILEVDPATREVVAEYDYRAVEDAPEHLYRKDYPTGVMEGLAVDENYFWLVTDNNGQARRQEAGDRRPTLFKCPRPRVR